MTTRPPARLAYFVMNDLHQRRYHKAAIITPQATPPHSSESGNDPSPSPGNVASRQDFQFFCASSKLTSRMPLLPYGTSRRRLALARPPARNLDAHLPPCGGPDRVRAPQSASASVWPRGRCDGAPLRLALGGSCFAHFGVWRTVWGCGAHLGYVAFSGAPGR
ncbi:hypothetical protein EJ06DRAFT_527647 [Trichodelitschia bisporula]|uniref:Uncharacterized protein n=1 Tax=Trichodelitschia bisporula TaxID=703511 RepID=A0A6G1I334_9PEZI|nr:hypothetical protein EJ06DRAFT_527647 [Trichodelitschia bisporula]